MYLHRERGLIYLAGRYTASTACGNALLRIGFERIGGHHHGLLGFDASGFEVATAVRNPWDWLVSARFRTLRDLADRLPLQSVRTTFPGWFELPWDPHAWEEIVEGPFGTHGDLMFPLAKEATKILHFESIEDDLFSFLGGEVPIWRENENRYRETIDWRRFFTPAGMDYVGNRFATEIMAFGYSPSRLDSMPTS